MLSTKKYYTLIFAYFIGFVGVTLYNGTNTLDNTTYAISDGISSKRAKAEPVSGIPVLAYHQIVSDTWAAQKNNFYTLDVGTFRSQMEWLTKEGYTTIKLDTLYAYVTGKKTELPEKPIVITFDDGTKGFTRHASEILEKHKFTAVLFIFPNATGKDRNYLNWEDLKKALNKGHEIETHSFTHPLLTKMSLKTQTAEFTKAKKLAQEKLGVNVKWMAYPFGTFNKHTTQALKDSGYTGAFTVYVGDNQRGQNPFFLNRYLVLHGQTLETFAAKIRQKSLPVKPALEPGSFVTEDSEIVFEIPKGLIKENIRVEVGKEFIRRNKNTNFSYEEKSGKLTVKVKNIYGTYVNVTIVVSGKNSETRRSTILYIGKRVWKQLK